jgi:hypothetical protein
VAGDEHPDPGPDLDGAPGDPLVVDIDTWSFAVLAGAALAAMAMFAVASVADDVLTGIGVGVVVGVALSPVVVAVQRRWATTRGSAVILVGTALALALAAIAAAVGVLPDRRELTAGLAPRMPPGVDYGEILPWLGFMLSGAAGMIWYSYWVRAKGYGAARASGTPCSRTRTASGASLPAGPGSWRVRSGCGAAGWTGSSCTTPS